MLLEIAVASQAEYIVTYNIRDFDRIELFGIEAVRPGEFLKILETL
jgi:predicted nucleic acid-binding protein